MSDNTVKLLLVGDKGCGKKSLLNVFLYKEYPMGYTPVLMGDEKVELTVKNTKLTLLLANTTGVSSDAVRCTLYENVDVVAMCFSVDKPESLKAVEWRWRAEVLMYCPLAPFLIVGTKIDLRKEASTESELEQFVQLKKGREVALRLRAYEYLECSAKDMSGVWSVFHTAALAALENKKKHCCVM